MTKQGRTYNKSALCGGSYNTAALRGGSYNTAALRGGSYNTAALRGGSYNTAALRGGSYNTAALRGGVLPHEMLLKRARNRMKPYDPFSWRAVFGDVPPEVSGIARPMRRGLRIPFPTVYAIGPNPSITPSDSKPIVKAPTFRPRPLKYMLDNGLTREDLMNE